MATAPSPPRRRLHWSAWTLIGLLGLLALLAIGTLQWLWRTDSGLAVVVRALPRLTQGVVTAEGPRGSLRHGFTLEQLRIAAGDTSVEIRALQARLADADLGLSLDRLRFAFEELTAERVHVRVRPSAKPDTGLPDSIASPVAVSTQRLAVGELVIATGPDPQPAELVLRSIDARVALDRAGYRIEQARLALGAAAAPLQLALDGTLGGAPPFALDARGTLSTALQEQAVQARWQASRSLVDLLLDAQVSGGGAQGDARVRLASFDAPTLRELRVDLKGVDPAAWVAGAPRATLEIAALLRPQDGEQFRLHGPVRVSNAAPGPVDQQRIPVRSARALLELTRESLLASDVVAELTRGSVRGRYQLSLQDVQRWQADAQLAGVDPLAIHSRLRSLVIDGKGRVTHENQTTAVTASLVNRGQVQVQAEVDLAVTPQRVRLDTVQLRLGPGHASVSGDIALDGEQRVRLQGTLNEFDPSVLAPEVQARITGSFDVDATLAPQPAGRLAFALSDSQAFGRPLAGGGTLVLAANQALDADIEMKVRSASLTARGGLGRPGQTLNVQLSVPQLKELGLEVAGSLAASARLAGDWHAPSGEAQVTAQRLRAGEHSLDDLRAIASYGGGTDGALALQLNASNHRFGDRPALSLASIELSVSGTAAEHRIELTANNEESQQLAFESRGGWQATKRLWQGEVTRLQAGAPLELRLQQPTAVIIGTSQWQVAPTTLSLAGAQVELLQLEANAGRIETRGRFTGLKVADINRPEARVIATARSAPAEPLTLQGQWQLRVGTAVDGSLTIERSSGDIHAGAGGGPMGMSELRVTAEARANRVQASARLRGIRAGVLNADLQADLDPARGWRLARARPWLITADANLPSIAWVSALLSDTVRTNLRIGGSLSGNLKIDGTPADPVAKGTFSGKELRVSWIEQAVRLQNGTLSARVDGSEIILEELRFTGAPSVLPSDRRAREAAGTDAGTLTVSGRLQLQDFSGVLQVQAQRMPLVQRVDRWVRADGGANIVFDQKRVQLNGAVAASAGYFDVSRPNLPTLSDDVQVVRSAEQGRAPREAPIGFAIDVGIDLGQNFYLKGFGLDTRIDGAVRLRSDGRSPIRATGTVEARDGAFEGYGQKLAIERGRVNFQGPPDNPGLDILAVRKDLPVTVGVSITRTAQNPLVRLYSDESLTDVQILSWLVLGRPAEEGQSSGDSAALATAAVGLLSGTSEGVPKQLARRLGIDEVGIRTGDLAGSSTSLLPRTAVAGNVRGERGANTVSEAIVTVGKRVNDELSISYEQAYSTNEAVLKVTYRLSKTFSLIGRAGTDSALDLVYSIAFD